MTTQYWISGLSGDWSDAADWASGVVPGPADGAVISSSNVTVDGTAAAYSLTLDSSTLTLSGTLTLGASLTVDDSATLTLNGGTLSAQSVSSTSGSSLSGYGAVGGAINGIVLITAAGGALQVQGSLAGDQGRFTIDAGATLELSTSNDGAAPVIFDGNPATLKLDAPAAFTGPIEGLVVGDTIDLVGITASSATYSGSTLTINETDGQQLTYDNVTGALTGDAVTVASDDNGGTLVYWGAAPAATTQYWISGLSGDWSDAADWASGVVPGPTDGAVISSSNVTVDGTAAAYSLTLDSSTLTLSGTLTLGASLTVDDSATLTLNGGTLSAQSVSSTSGSSLSGYGAVGGAINGIVLITAAGGALQVQGSLAGDQGRFTIDAGATLELSTSNDGAAPVIFDGNPATLKLDAPAAFTGPIEGLVVGDTIDLVGITASSATYSGSTLTINETDGQQLTYDNVTGALTGDAVTVASDDNGGTLVYWSATSAMTTQYWISGLSGDWSDAADWASGVVPGPTDGAVISSSNVTVDGTAAAYSLTLDSSTLTLSGTLTLGASLTVDDSATLTLNGGTLSAQSVSSTSGSSLSGYGAVGGAINGIVLITAAGGALQVQGSLAGDQGRFTIDAGATLELSTSNDGAAPVIFDGNPATLKLDAPAAFTGPIEGLVVGDAIDLVGITASSATYSGSTLTINETDGQQLTYDNVTGALTGDAVTVASDDNGGTLVYWGAAPAATTQYWISGLSGDWSDAADWASGVVPGPTDGAVISSSNVTVDGTAAAYSLTLDSSTLTLSGTLTLGASLTVDDSATLTLNGGTLSAQSVSSTSGSSLSGYGAVGGAINGIVLITAAGGALQVQGSLAGDQGRFTIDAGATLELSTSNDGAAPVIFDGNPATLKLDAPAAFTGPIEGLVVGDAIDLVGITASSATYSGSTLTINETDGQQLTYDNVTGALTGDAVTVASDDNGGTLVYWGAAPAATTQYWIAGLSGDWSDAADWASGVVPTSADDVVINNSNAVTVNGTAVANSLALDGSSYLSVGGALTLGASLILDGGTLALSGGTLSAQSITNVSENGYLFGHGTVSGAVSGDVVITADGGTLDVQGPIAGDHAFLEIDTGATLELSNASDATVYFYYSNESSGTLKLDAPVTFTGEINQFALGDTIDLAGITASSATYSGTTLTINETNGQQLNYNVSGSIAGDTLLVASDNDGGTLVYWTQPPVSWISGLSGDWSDAADWASGVVPTSADDVVINNSNAVTVNGTAVANSLALDGSSYLSVGGALTLGASLILDGGTLALSGGTLSAQSITNVSENGYLFGHGTVSGAVSGDVVITADGGTLDVQGPIAGDHAFLEIDTGATLELSNASDATVYFYYSNESSGTLKLDAPVAFTGEINQFALGDTIDLAGITASSATYSGTTLTINETNGQQLNYNVSGSIAGDTLLVASDNDGGTLVYWTQPPVSWISGLSGDWSDAADWASGVVPTSADDVVINNSNAVTVNGTAVANSLALDGSSYLSVGGALTLGASLILDGGTLALSGGTLSAQSITNVSENGYLFGHGTVSGAVSGDVVITADGGTLDVQGPIAGDHAFLEIDTGATLELSNASDATVYFYYSNESSGTLKLDAPVAFTGEINQFALGDTIDLAGITASSATYSGTTLTINETNGQQLNYNVSGSIAGDILTVASDNNGGTLVYWSTAPATTPPTISGTVADQTTTSEATLDPFAGVTIGDANNGGTNVDTLTITLSGSGTLSGAGPLGAGEVYTLTGTAAQLTDALQAIIFTPIDGVPNTSVTTGFALNLTDPVTGGAVSDNTTTVIDSDPAVAPTIAGTKSGQTTTSEAALKPFSGVMIGDANNGGTNVDTLTITLSGSGALSGAGPLGAGDVYMLTGTAAQLTGALRAIVFTPVDGVPNTSVTTGFTLNLTDPVTGGAVSDNTTTVIDSDPAVPPTITGTKSGQTTTSEAALKPFATVTIGDANSGATDTLTIEYSCAGALSGAGLSGSIGDYTLSGTAAAITTALDALLFTPVDGVPNTSVTTTFTLSDLSSAYGAPTVNSATTVVDHDPAVAPTSTIAETVTLAPGASPSIKVSGVATDVDTGLASVTMNGGSANLLGTDGDWSYSQAALASGSHSYISTITDRLGLHSSVTGSVVTVNSAKSIALAGTIGGDTVNASTGNSQIGITDTAANGGHNTINASNGNNKIAITDGAGYNTVDASGGNNGVTINDSGGDNMLSVSGGNNEIAITDRAGYNTVDALGGNNAVTINDTGGGDNTLSVSGGNNKVAITDGAGYNKVAASGGNSAVAIDDPNGGGNSISVSGGNDSVKITDTLGKDSITLAGGDNIVNIGGSAGGDTITADTNDTFTYTQLLSHYDHLNNVFNSGTSSNDVFNLSALAGATKYEGTITSGTLNADSVGFLYNSLLHETSVFVNTTGAAESLTGASAISPMLELAGSGNLTAANFKLAHA